jgi:hypothetical protein
MRYLIKKNTICLVWILLAGSFATAATLTITPYTDPNTIDYQGNDSLQLGLAEKGILAESFQTSPPGENPICFGTTTADAVGYGDYGLTFATSDWWDTAIVYSLNVNSRWWNNNILKDVTIYVLPTADARRFYNFQVQYTLNDGTGVYYDAVIPGSTLPTQIADTAVPLNTGTIIKISDINVANVSQVWIWATPAESGFQKFSTTIAEIDVNFESCSAYPDQDLNADCSVDLTDLTMLASDWLLN